MKLEFVEMVRLTPNPAGDKYKIIFIGHASWWERVVLRQDTLTVVEYVGDCTVWHRLPEFRRAGTFMESFLCEIWNRERHFDRVTDEAS